LLAALIVYLVSRIEREKPVALTPIQVAPGA
jgi:hypothetical protein